MFVRISGCLPCARAQSQCFEVKVAPLRSWKLLVIDKHCGFRWRERLKATMPRNVQRQFCLGYRIAISENREMKPVVMPVKVCLPKMGGPIQGRVKCDVRGLEPVALNDRKVQSSRPDRTITKSDLRWLDPCGESLQMGHCGIQLLQRFADLKWLLQRNMRGNFPHVQSHSIA